MKRNTLLSLLLIFAMLACFTGSALAQEGTIVSATAQGFGGIVSVELTLSADGTILNVNATGDAETNGIGSRAIELLPDAIVAANSTEVDIITGATISSQAVLSAAKMAYAQVFSDATSPLQMTPGVYTSTQNSYGGPLTLQVVLEADRISSVEIVENKDTYGIGSIAIDVLPEAIVNGQTTGVDTITGASITSNAIKRGVRECLTEAGALDTDLAAPIPTEVREEAEVLRTNVVVVGSGISGTAAAMRAMELGADVVMLEKLSVTGGSAKYSLGWFAVCETPENKGYHITSEDDTLEAALARWKQYQDTSLRESAYPDYDRLSFQLTQSVYTLDWLKSLGATFTPNEPIAARGVANVAVDIPSITEGTGASKLLAHLRSLSEKEGMVIRTDTRATELITDGDKIIGVRAESKTGPVEVYADQVILATGGYSESAEMLNRLIPGLPEVSSYASPGNTGDGIIMAEKVGAALYEDQWIHNGRPRCSSLMRANSMYCDVFMQYSSPIEGEEAYTHERLMVDCNGERFMNEGEPYSSQDMDMFRQNKAPYWSLYCDLSPVVTEVAEAGIACGEVIKANSISELAEQAGMDPAVLEATVARYREMIAKGEDTDFGKDPAYLLPISEEGPYYLVHILPGACDTLGGIKTNYDQQVLREDGSVIDGLYATGAMTNGVYYNQYYFSATQLTFGATTGKIAGENAATAALK